MNNIKMNISKKSKTIKKDLNKVKNSKDLKATTNSTNSKQYSKIKKEIIEINEIEAKPKTHEKVLFTASRNIPFLGRHLMKDIISIMPFIKTENKISLEDGYLCLKEKCEQRKIDKLFVFEENPLCNDNIFTWISNESRDGPSIKCLVDNIHSMAELKLEGDCIQGSKAVLSFSSNFDDATIEPQWKLLKNVLLDSFKTPTTDKKTKHVCDRILTFTLLNDRVWARHYQINTKFNCLDEIGPRFAFKPIQIREGALAGKIIFQDKSIDSMKYK